MMVDDMLAGKVISLFQGRFEWGPRALGNRSILADPRSAAMKDSCQRSYQVSRTVPPLRPGGSGRARQ